MKKLNNAFWKTYNTILFSLDTANIKKLYNTILFSLDTTNIENYTIQLDFA